MKRYGLALAGVAAAAAALWVLPSPLHEKTVAAAFLLAVLAASFGGFGPALLTTLLGLAGQAAFLALREPPSPISAPSNWIPLAVYAVAGSGIALAMRWRQQSLQEVSNERDQLGRSANDLRDRVAALERTTRRAQAAREEASATLDALRQEFHVSEERMRMVQAAGRLCLFDWDIDRGAMYTGAELQEIFGIQRAAWHGYEDWIQAVHPEDRERIEREVAACLAGEGLLDVEFRVLWPDGSQHWVIARGSALRDEHTVRRMAGIFQDVTQRKATEDALVASEKLATAGRLAASIAHEINNPLAAVTNLLYIIRNDATLSGAGRHYLALAEQELARAAEIAKRALGFYKDQVDPSDVDISELLDDMLSFYRRNMPAHVTLTGRYERNLHAHVREGEIRQVVSNLLTNALQALAEGGSVEVEAHTAQQRGEKGVLIQVHDSGAGIDPGHLERVFEPFFTTGKSGTGLGLWLVKEIVTKHGGSVAVESARAGERQGTTFSIFLPARAHAQRTAGDAARGATQPTARAS